MRGFKGVLRKKRNRLIILLLAFLVVDVALISYTFSLTTDSKQGALVQSGLLISEGETSAFGSTVFLAEDSLYSFTPTGLVKFEESENLTSYAFAYLSEAVVVVTEHRVLNFYPRGSIAPSFSKVMESDTEVICIREQATGVDYYPVDIVVVSSNQTGSYFIPVYTSGQGSLGTATLLPGSMVSHASARSGGYVTIACDDGTMTTFRIGREGAIATIPYDGQILDMVMVDNGMKMYVLHQGGSIVAVKPSNGMVYSWTNLSSSASKMVLGEDGENVYSLDGDALMAISGPSGVPIFSGKDITAYAVPGSNNYIICQNGLVSFFEQERENALWDGSVQGIIVGANTDFGAILIFVWTDRGELLTYDNSSPTLGAREWWLITGTVIVLQLFVLVGLAWGRAVFSNGSNSVILLFAGAMAGLIVTIIFPNESGVEWFGGELPVAVIVISAGAVACYAAWESGSGAWGVILGVIAGSITSAIVGLVMMFLLWATGTEFGGDDAFFTTLANSVPIGFTSSIAAGIVGLVLTYALVPKEKKKRARS